MILGDFGNLATNPTTKAYFRATLDRSGSQINEEIFAYAHCLKMGYEYLGSFGLVNYSDHSRLLKMLDLPATLNHPGHKVPSRFAGHILIKDTDYSSKAYPDPNLLIDGSFINSLRQKFLTRNKPPAYSKPRIAVHVRRGDIGISNMRYTPNSYYVSIVKKIKEVCPDSDLLIFSESKSDEAFDVFQQLGCQLQLDTDLEAAWKEMIFADVLVMSKGSFSYVPAIYNSNFVIFQPAWYTKLNHWHHIEDPELWSKLKAFLTKKEIK